MAKKKTEDEAASVELGEDEENKNVFVITTKKKGAGNDIPIDFEELKIPASPGEAPSDESSKIGEVTCVTTRDGGNITLKIEGRPDNLKLGQPIMIDTDIYKYYCMINVLEYPENPTAQRFANTPFVNLIPSSQVEGVRGKEFYGLSQLACLKIIPTSIDTASEMSSQLREFDTIPPIFSPGRGVTDSEIGTVYQKSEKSDTIGSLRGFDYMPPIDFSILVKKPYGIFGRTGVGKSVLNKLLCLHILKQDVSRLVLFDMQGEYGTISRTSDHSRGLKFYFNDKIKIYRILSDSSTDTMIDDAEPFVFYKENIRVSDVISSIESITEPMINALYKIDQKRADDQNLLDAVDEADAEKLDLNKNSVNALKNRLVRFKNFTFLKDAVPDREDSIEDMFTNLKAGKSIVIDFGKFGTDSFLYFFISNAISRRLYEKYSEKEETGEELPPLVIVLEEAHKFLGPSMAKHTIFDKIAREMRKFQLTIAFVDQRPSQIDDEVFSQISNRFIMNLTDPKDMDAVTSNLPNPKKWRQIVSSLQNREALVYGDAISVPTIIRALDYQDFEKLKDKLDINMTTSEVDEAAKKVDLKKMFKK